MRVFTLFFLALLTFACRGDAKPKQHHIHTKNPLKFFQTLWSKIRNKSDAEPEVVCTITGAKNAANEKRAELQELDNQKASLQKVIKKLNNDMEKLKLTTQTARRDLSNVLLEKTRGEKSITDVERQKEAKKEDNTTNNEPFPGTTVLTFTTVALLLCFIAALSKIYESNVKITKLTQRLVSKAHSPSVVVEKEVLVHRNRITELETQGQRERAAALAETASLQEQLDRYKEENVGFQRQVSELKKEQEDLRAAAASKDAAMTATKGSVSPVEGGRSVVSMVVMEDALEGSVSRTPMKSKSSAGVSAGTPGLVASPNTTTSATTAAADLALVLTAKAVADKQVEALTAQGKKDADEINALKTRATELEAAKATADRSIADLTAVHVPCAAEIASLKQGIAELEAAKVTADRSIADLTAAHAPCGTEIASLKQRITELEAAKVTADRSIADLTRQISGDRDEITRLKQLQQQQQGAIAAADEQKKQAVASLEQALEQAATQATKTSNKLREEKDVALTEWKRASDMVDTLEDRVGVLTNDLEGVKTERDGLKREKEQWLAAKNSLTLSMEHSKTELASSMQRISELEEVGKGQAMGCQQLVVVKRERDELLEGKARTDQCFLDMESQLTQEKRKVMEHLNTIRELEQRLMEIERRKHSDRVSYSTGLTTSPGQGRGSSFTPPHGTSTAAAAAALSEGHGRDTPSTTSPAPSSSAVATRSQELMSQTDNKDANNNSNNPDNSKLQAQLAALLKQRDLLLTSKTILEEHIGEYKAEIKWCDNDRERLKEKEMALEKQVQSLDSQLTTQQQQMKSLQTTVHDLTGKNAALEASSQASEAQISELRERVTYLVAAKDAKERDHRRDLQQMKETRDRSDVLESTCGELTQQLARMQEQRDALRVKAAHARFGARAHGTSPGAVGGAGGGVSSSEPGRHHRSSDHLVGNVDGEGGSSDDGTEDTWREVVQRGGNEGDMDSYRTATNNSNSNRHAEEGDGNGDSQSLRAYLRRAQKQKAMTAAAASSSSSNVKQTQGQGQGPPPSIIYPPVEEDSLLADLRQTQSQRQQRQQQQSASAASSSSKAKRLHNSSSSSSHNKASNSSLGSTTSVGDDTFFGNTNSVLTAIQSFLSVSTDQPQISTQEAAVEQQGVKGGPQKRDDDNDSLFGLILPKT